MIIPTDVELVDYAAATYAPGGTPFINDLGSSVCVYLSTRPDGLNIIAIEGTHNVYGWVLDFLATRMTDQEGVNHPTLGFVHSGFYLAARSMIDRLDAVAAKGPYAICGHSLGAALALLLGGMLIDDGVPPVKIGAFAPPRVGGSQFVKVVTSVPFCAYAFGDDPVPNIPFTIPPDFPYEQVPITDIGAPMPNRFDCHSIVNYVSGVTALGRELYA
jgi:hypothetical protein